MSGYLFPRGSEPTFARLLTATRRDENGCYVWQRHVNERGYGHVMVQRKTWAVHRLAWTLVNGPIPDGLTVDHECFNPSCVRPSHMRILTAAENAAASRRALSSLCKRGHEFTPENTNTWRTATGEVRRCRTCQRVVQRNYDARRRSEASA